MEAKERLGEEPRQRHGPQRGEPDPQYFHVAHCQGAEPAECPTRGGIEGIALRGGPRERGEAAPGPHGPTVFTAGVPAWLRRAYRDSFDSV